MYRRIRLFNHYDENLVLPSLASALVAPLFDLGRTIRLDSESVDLGSLRVPLDGNGNFLINPYGRVQAFSAAAVIKSLRQIRAGKKGESTLNPALFAGKLVLVGASAIGLLDVKPTALAAAEPGVLLHAYTISNLLDQDFLQAPSTGTKLLGLLLICCASVFAMSQITTIRFFLPPVGIGLIYLAGAYTAFSYNLLLPLSAG